MKKAVFAIFVLMLIVTGANAQFSEMMKKSEVHGSFEFDGTYYLTDNAMGITDSVINGRNFAFNGFGDIIYTLGRFSAGLRYEAYLPPVAGFDPQLEGQGFPYIWAKYTAEKLTFTVGSFYEQFGMGLSLRAYEEWTLGYDNAINGARVTYEPVKGLIMKAVYGSQRFFWSKWLPNTRGIVKGFDAEVDFNQVIKSMENSRFRLNIGASAVSKYQADNDPIYKLPRNVSNLSGRFTMGIGNFIFSSEYAWKVNDPSAINNYIYKDGDALVFTMSYSTKGFGFFGMFKRLDNMSYKSDRAVNSNALDINFLPPNTEIHNYMFTAMYPYSTQPNGEIGFQLQVNYKIPRKSKLGGKYGLGISINYSQVNNIDRKPINDSIVIDSAGTLGWTSPFFSFGNPVFWQDFNIRINKKFSKKFKATFMYMYQTYDIAILQGHPEKPTIHANIGVVEMTYKFSSRNALRWEAQGFWTQQDKGSWLALLLEYTISPHWFFAFSDQYNYGNPVVEDQLHYYNLSFGYTRRTSRIALTYGRQREGIVCVGGVCRQVPAANGFTITITSTF